MKIGIIVAMGKELELLKPMLQDGSEQVIDSLTFLVGTVGQHNVVAMQCGIGKVNAAIGTVTLINHFAPDAVINSGVAGGADKSVNVMDVVVGARVAYHDVWCGPECPMGRVQGLPLYYEGTRIFLDHIEVRDDIKLGLICSGDRFIDKMSEVEAIKANFPEALAVDMESGAIAQVCCVRKVPFLSMRVISDSPGASHNNTKQYNDFWEAAPQQTFEVLHNLLLTVK
ncbi:MAG: 5'-methylthioadenosine/adenosylhomocysteine nucleosidase [Bacteroidales bacterium]|nr:5'-methylthioadenosine/adenosylhomocysteine nucleosidase [Candidatus Sodaliphilus fimicaballi]